MGGERQEVGLAVVLLLSWSEPPESVPLRLDDDERHPQIIIWVTFQNPLKFRVDRVLGRREYAEVEDTGSQRVHKDRTCLTLSLEWLKDYCTPWPRFEPGIRRHPA